MPSRSENAQSCPVSIGWNRGTAKIWPWPLAVWFVCGPPTRLGSSRCLIQGCRKQLQKRTRDGWRHPACGRDGPPLPGWPLPHLLRLRRARESLQVLYACTLQYMPAFAVLDRSDRYPPRCRMSAIAARLEPDSHCLGSPSPPLNKPGRQGTSLKGSRDRPRQWSLPRKLKRTPNFPLRHPVVLHLRPLRLISCWHDGLA